MREMKNSGIERIGEIPSDWKICRFRNIVNIYNGNSIKDEEKANYEDAVDAIPYIATKDIDATFQTINYNNGMYIKAEDKSFKKAPYNSVLLCIEGGSAGKKIAFTNQEVCFINKLCCFHSNIVNNKFLFYYMQSPSFTEEFKNHISGLIGGVSISEIKGFSFVFAPIEEQEKIVAYLDEKCAEIDTVIEKTKATIEEYKMLKQSVITQAVTKGIRSNRPMKDSGIEWIKKIPLEWNSINPKALFEQRKEKAKQGERQLTASQQYGVIYQEEYMKITGTKVVTVEKDFEILKHVEAGDFVISMRSFQGGLEYSEKTGSISSAYVMLIPNNKCVFPRYFKWLFKSSLYINALQSTSNMVRDGQAMRYSNFSQVRLYTVPLDEQKEIADYLDKKCSEIDELIAKKTALLSELESYKKSLIYEYVTGKKEV